MKKIILLSAIAVTLLASAFIAPPSKETVIKPAAIPKQVTGYYGKVGSGLTHAVIFYINASGTVLDVQASNSTGGCGTLDLIYSYTTPVVEYHSGWRLKYPVTVSTNNGTITVGSGLLSSGYSWCP